MRFLEEELDALRAAGLFRVPMTLERIGPAAVRLGGRRRVVFCSNDYLGLASDPRLKRAAMRAVERYGWGAGAARLISGTSPLHTALEEEIARFEGAEAAVLFATGYMTNLGAVTALVGERDLVVGDRLNHASIIDACWLSRARFRVYPHGDVDALKRILARHTRSKIQNLKSKILVVTDGVFSMDGDLAPLREIAALKARYEFILMVDEAHGTGVFGRRGRGAAEHLGVEEAVDVRMGTLSKAVGSIGGFIAGRRALIELLVNKARSYIYSTALPPAACAASIEGLRIIREEPGLRRRLWRNVELLRRALRKAPLPRVASPIIPLIVGDPQRAVELSQALLERGFLVSAVRPPAVPRGTSRLRVTASAAHTKTDIVRLGEAWKEVMRKNLASAEPREAG
jgi:8-amino-7-oxononanoate synthase